SRRHTRFSRDWSSDVCSSDLAMIELPDSLELEAGLTLQLLTLSTTSAIPTTLDYDVSAGMHLVLVLSGKVDIQIGRAQALCYVRSEERRVGKEGRGSSWQHDA